MSARNYYRPLVQTDVARPDGAYALAGGWGWFTQVEVLSRSASARVIAACDMPEASLRSLCDLREPIAGLSFEHPQIMGILNATPDSFSDGGAFCAAADAVRAGQDMVAKGATLLDIGGESTRPGADFVPVADEIARVVPVIEGLRAAGIAVPISIDTRKAAVARAALDAGAELVNDVSGFTFDADLAPDCAHRGVPVCVMHALGDPATMQNDPQYDNVLLDVYDFLETQIETLTAQGVARSRIIADPGIGFGKTLAHNLTLLARLGLFHSLGVPVLLGASRKRFIGTIGGVAQAKDRAAGSVGVGLAALGHGIQMHRVHDVDQTKQAMALWHAGLTGQNT